MIKKTEWEWKLLNDAKALWLRSPSEVEEEEYEKFYSALTKVKLITIHMNVVPYRVCLVRMCNTCRSAMCGLLTIGPPPFTIHFPRGPWFSSISPAVPSANKRHAYPVLYTVQGMGGKPLSYAHFKAEGDVEFKAILYVPDKAPHDFLDNYYSKKPSLKLYVRRVFISDDFEDLIPR